MAVPLLVHPQVLEVSRRLLQLQGLLGGSSTTLSDTSTSSSSSSSSAFWSGASGGSGGAGPDVSWMVVREPRLLTADFGQLMLRLIDMKVGVHIWYESVGTSGVGTWDGSEGEGGIETHASAP